MLSRLNQLGLDEEESGVYLAMLELGGGYASAIAKRAHRKRSSAYHTLKKLCDKGLASRVQKGPYQYFSPESPEKIVQLAKLRFDSAVSLLPELLSIQNTRTDKPRVKFYERASGIEEIFEQTLLAKEEILGYTNLSLLADRFPDLLRKYTRERIKAEIKVRYLSPLPEEGSGFIEKLLPRSGKSELLEIFFIDPSQYIIHNEIAIFENKVAVMSLKLDEPIGLLIESQTVSTTMRSIFDLAWIGASSFVAR